MRNTRTVSTHDVTSMLFSALRLRGADIAAHSQRVAYLSRLLGQACVQRGQGRVDFTALSTGALLHDLGKIALPDAIFQKTDTLTDDEWRLIRQHPEDGAALLAPLPEFSAVIPILLSHHERWDGSGYPQKLAGTEIPLLARLVAIADVYDALTSERSYHSALSAEAARQELWEKSGTLFDPGLTALFLTIPVKQLAAAKDDAAPRQEAA